MNAAETTVRAGLSTVQAAVRLADVGPNALPERAPDPVWRRFVRQFQSPLIYILMFALVFAAGLWIYEGARWWPIEALAIAVILLLNPALGRVPADGALVETHGAMVDEAILTGESVPMDKAAGDEALSGTLIVLGKTFLEITRTGASSAMGR